eukprot:UC1_evm3s1043
MDEHIEELRALVRLKNDQIERLRTRPSASEYKAQATALASERTAHDETRAALAETRARLEALEADFAHRSDILRQEKYAFEQAYTRISMDLRREREAADTAHKERDEAISAARESDSQTQACRARITLLENKLKSERAQNLRRQKDAELALQQQRFFMERN